MSKNVHRLPTARKRPVRNPVAVLDGTEGNVEGLDIATTHDLPPGRVLAQAQRAELTDVVVCGFDAEGQFFFSSSNADGGDALWLLALAQKKLLEVGE